MKIRLISMLLMFISVAVFTGIASAQTKYKADTVVYAEWVKNGWYHGKIGAECEKGFTINFDDGDVKCCTEKEIVADVVPGAAEVKTGSKVLAQWSDGKFYPGKVAKIEGDNYSINFDDGDKGNVTIDKIRLFK